MTSPASSPRDRHDPDAAPVPRPEPWSRNLLHTFDELVEHLAELSAAREPGAEPHAVPWDGYFTLCALSQILDDFVHRGFLGLAIRLEVAIARPQKLDGYLDVAPARLADAVRRFTRGAPVRLLARLADAIVAGRVKMRAMVRERHLLRQAARLHALATELAFAMADTCGSDGSEGAKTRAVLEQASAELARGLPPALRRRVLKVPACFKDFDLRPEDCRALVERFAAGGADTAAPLTVVGIRTSGSYLAPVCAAYLRQAGFRDVAVETMRPKVPLFAAERRVLRRRRAGFVLLVDDPPVTGRTLQQALRTLVRIGVPPDRLVLLIPAEPDCSGGAGHPSGPAVVLSRTEWKIRELLEAPELREAARQRFVSHAAGRVPRLSVLPLVAADAPAGEGPLRYRTSRCHAKVRLVAHADGGRCVAVAKGIGIGWFAEHSREVAHALEGFVPDAWCGPDGILLTRWVDGPSLADRPDACDEATVRAVARYVAARADRLGIHSGRRGDLEDRDTGWQVMARCFARGYSLLAPLAYRRLRREFAAICLDAPRVALDGRMGPAEWIVPARGGPAVKVDFEEHDFDRMELGVFDPVFDLASFVVENHLPHALARVLVSEYVACSGDATAPSRLPHYELMAGMTKLAELRLALAAGGSVALGFERGTDRTSLALAKTDVERWLSRTANDWLARALSADEPAVSPDRLFAVDVDGVLEDGTLGFSATTPAGALALRAMKRHGFIPVLTTGRSLGEVMDRCRTFRLSAGIAEYGSVVWIDGGTPPHCLASPEELDQLARLRDLLAGTAEAIVDPAYAHSVRVFQYCGGLRRAMSAGWMRELLQANRLDRLRVIRGDEQLDVVGRSCSKRRGVRFAQHALRAREVHAVGDTMEDVGMLRRADHPYAPGNVHGSAVAAMARRPLFVARRRRQRGLLDIARVAAHGRNRICHLCEVPPLAAADAVLLDAFGIRDRSRIERLGRVAGRAALDLLFSSH